jgi:hypothetical protein
MGRKVNRRAFLGKSVATAGVAGMVASGSASSTAASTPGQDDAQVGATKSPSSAAGMPRGKIGDVEISRVILGSNLMTGYSHSRDLRYVGPLMRAYNSEEKILETLSIAEANGINTLSQGDWKIVQKYNNECGGHMQQLGPLKIKRDDNDVDIKNSIKQLVDQSSTAIYLHGHTTDILVMNGMVDKIAKAVQWIKDEGLPAGVGGHSLNVVIESERQQVNPDFYFKTFHDDGYWSATMAEHREEFCWYKGRSSEPGHYNDNMWCIDAEETATVMRNVKAAWIAFKVLAAGAIHPKQGFSYAFRNGADFIVVGMFDFQVQQNAQLAKQILRKLDSRERPWMA